MSGRSLNILPTTSHVSSLTPPKYTLNLSLTASQSCKHVAALKAPSLVESNVTTSYTWYYYTWVL